MASMKRELSGSRWHEIPSLQGWVCFSYLVWHLSSMWTSWSLYCLLHAS